MGGKVGLSLNQADWIIHPWPNWWW